MTSKKLLGLRLLALSIVAVISLILLRRNRFSDPDIKNVVSLNELNETIPLKAVPSAGQDTQTKTAKSNLMPVVSGKLEKWNAIAQGGSIRLVDRDRNQVNPALVTLLDLNPLRQSAVSEKIRAMMDFRRKLECESAYVAVAANGDEEIIIPEIKSDGVLEFFENSLRGIGLDQDIVDFLAERALLDPNLALLESPVTLTVETASDGVVKRITTQGKVSAKTTLAHLKEAELNGGISPIMLITTYESLDSNADGRFDHIWAIVATLPRKAK